MVFCYGNLGRVRDYGNHSPQTLPNKERIKENKRSNFCFTYNFFAY